MKMKIINKILIWLCFTVVLVGVMFFGEGWSEGEIDNEI